MSKAWLALAVCVTAAIVVAAQGTDATKSLSAAREALGGEKKIAAVKTFTTTGRTRQVRGESLAATEFSLACELPDKYVRTDQAPGGNGDPTSNGFSGDALIQDPPPSPMPVSPTPPSAAPGAPSPQAQLDAARATRVTSMKQDFARLTLGMFASSFSSYPLTFTYAAQAQAPEGKADVIDVKGAGNFSARLFINSETHLPIMLSWQVPVTLANIIVTVPGQAAPANLAPGATVVEGPPPPAAGASKDDITAYQKALQDVRKNAMTTAKPIEYRWFYSDYRDEDGLQLPHVLRRAIAGQTVEEMTFDRFKLNAKIDPKKFETVK